MEGGRDLPCGLDAQQTAQWRMLALFQIRLSYNQPDARRIH